MAIEAVVFDMDGVLIDTEPTWENVEIEVFNSIGVPLTREMCWQTTGMRINEVVQYWFDRFPWEGPSQDEVSQRVLQGMVDHVKADGEAMEGVYSAIQFFRSKGLRFALASSSFYVLIDAVMERLQLEDVFEFRYSAQDELLGKPDPAVYLTAAQKLGLEPSQCLAIEDSVNGLKAAVAAGYRTIAVPDARHFGSPEYEIADITIAALDELDNNVWKSLKISQE